MRPIDLNDAVRHAVELEAFYRAENRQTGLGFMFATVRSKTADDKKLSDAFASLSCRLEEMTEVMNKQQQRTMNNRSENQY